MTDWNPQAIAAEISGVADRLESSAKVVSDAKAVHLAAKRDYLIALAVHRQDENNKGSFADRSDRALIDFESRIYWEKMDTADVAHTYSRDLADALEKKLSGLQTNAKLFLADYSAANRMT